MLAGKRGILLRLNCTPSRVIGLDINSCPDVRYLRVYQSATKFLDPLRYSAILL